MTRHEQRLSVRTGWAVANPTSGAADWDGRIDHTEESARRELATAIREVPTTDWYLIRWEAVR